MTKTYVKIGVLCRDTKFPDDRVKHWMLQRGISRVKVMILLIVLLTVLCNDATTTTY